MVKRKYAFGGFFRPACSPYPHVQYPESGSRENGGEKICRADRSPILYEFDKKKVLWRVLGSVKGVIGRFEESSECFGKSAAVITVHAEVRQIRCFPSQRPWAGTKGDDAAALTGFRER